MTQKRRSGNSFKVLTVLILSICVSVAAMEFIVRRAGAEMQKGANTEAELNTVALQRIASTMFLTVDWCSNSFLANIATIKARTDSITGDTYYPPVITDERLSTLHTDDLYKMLSSFTNYNNDLYSAILIFKPGVIADAPARGIAAQMRPNDTTRYDLLEQYRIFDSPIYDSTANHRGIFFSYGTILNHAVWMITYSFPLYDQRGDVIGEFWIDSAPEAYVTPLQTYQSDDDLMAWLLTEDGKFVTGNSGDFHGKDFTNATREFLHTNISRQWEKQVRASLKNHQQAQFRSDFNGNTVRTYITPVKKSPFYLMIVKPETSIYKTAHAFHWQFLLVLLGSFILICLCLIYAYRSFKREDNAHQSIRNALQTAASIQRGCLPPNPTEANRHPAFNIHGFLQSARLVGGDMYDFVVRGNLLHFCIGDVSGKGVSASLIATQICSLYRLIVHTQSDAAVIASTLNNAIMESNDDTMFCTLWVGVLNLRTGHLEYCNAGHNPPILQRKENPESANCLKIKPNMPINAFEHYPYQKEELELKKGDRLLLYTDGVTEAKSRHDTFFGLAATLDCVQKNRELSLDQLAQKLMREIRRFTLKAEQNDDITMLFLEYSGMDENTLHFDCVKGRVTEIVDATLNACQRHDDLRLRLALEESIQNISDYAYETDGPVDISVVEEDHGNSCRFTIADNGIPFNPLNVVPPDLSVPIEERSTGGLGIHLTRQVMGYVQYQYQNNQNLLILKYQKK